VRDLQIIRFGALGDLCLLAWSLAPLARGSGTDAKVTLITKTEFAELMAAVPGVDEVIALRGTRLRDLVHLAGDLRSRPAATLVDAHGVLRARLLTLLLGRRAAARIDKDTAERLRLVLSRRGSARLQGRTMRDRFDEVLRRFWPPQAAGEPPAPPLVGLAAPSDDGTDAAPGVAGTSAATGDASGASAAPILGIAPGARWDTKRWPQERFAALVRDFRRRTPSRLRIFLGPREATWFAGGALAEALDDLAGVEILRDQPLLAVARGLAGCALTLTNDSGLLHLSEAVGTPVVALFGPTVRAFGYEPSLPSSHLLEVDLTCRPCSRNGRRPCWRGDLACLTGLATSQVLDTVLAAVEWPPTTSATAEAPA